MFFMTVVLWSHSYMHESTHLLQCKICNELVKNEKYSHRIVSVYRCLTSWDDATFLGGSPWYKQARTLELPIVWSSCASWRVRAMFLLGSCWFVVTKWINGTDMLEQSEQITVPVDVLNMQMSTSKWPLEVLLLTSMAVMLQNDLGPTAAASPEV